MKTIWFTSDTHFSHNNIIRYCNRPFSNVEEMDKALINNWNNKVKQNDDVYHLGDIIFSRDKNKTYEFLKKLNGRKHIIWGNHDKHKSVVIESGFIDCGQLHEMVIPLGGNNEIQKVVLCHYPLASWNGAYHGVIHLHGHCHGTLPCDKTLLRMDVGVDCCGYSPVNYEDIRHYLSELSPLTATGSKNML